MKCNFQIIGVLLLLGVISFGSSFLIGEESPDQPSVEGDVAAVAARATHTEGVMLKKQMAVRGVTIQPLVKAPGYPFGLHARVDCSGVNNTKQPGRDRVLTIAECIRAQYGYELSLAAHLHDLPEKMLLAVMIVESEGNPGAVSSTGCLGLMQICPETARAYQVPERRLFDPWVSIRGGARILSDYQRRAGSFDRGLAWYRFGPTGVTNKGAQYQASAEPYAVRIKEIFTKL